MSATCSRMYAEQVTTRSARFAIHLSTPWMCDCGGLSTQPWWRPYSVAGIVTTNGQRKRVARGAAARGGRDRADKGAAEARRKAAPRDRHEPVVTVHDVEREAVAELDARG